MNKLKIEKLKVKSFVTGIEEATSETVKGGADATVGGKNPCLTVVTYGYWTHCCEDSGYICDR